MVNGESKGLGGKQMVIRRIREHVATHNWFAAGFDRFGRLAHELRLDLEATEAR